MEINYLLVAVLILFAIFTIRGYKKGFLRIVVYFIGILFILYAVKKISPGLSNYLTNNTSVYTRIKEEITESLKEKNSVLDNSIEANQKLTIESYDMPDVLKEMLNTNNNIQIYKSLFVEVFEDYVSSFLAKTAVNALSFLGLFITLWVVFRIVLGLCNLITKIPIIKGANKLLGAALGFSEALIISWLFFFVAVIFMGNEFGSKIIYMVTKSKLLHVLFNSNILMYFV